jgi:hypothetical protein
MSPILGYAGKDDLIAFLNELLEAERAGARVTLESARAAGSGAIAELMRTIQRDEARWCGMLLRHLKALGDEPSSKVGAFYDKAMAIADLGERITFLNRGQGWVVRKLREMQRCSADEARPAGRIVIHRIVWIGQQLIRINVQVADPRLAKLAAMIALAHLQTKSDVRRSDRVRLEQTR